MISPRDIALDGIGGTPRLIAVRGLAAADGAPPSAGDDWDFRLGGRAEARGPRDEDETLILWLLH